MFLLWSGNRIGLNTLPAIQSLQLTRQPSYATFASEGRPNCNQNKRNWLENLNSSGLWYPSRLFVTAQYGHGIIHLREVDNNRQPSSLMRRSHSIPFVLLDLLVNWRRFGRRQSVICGTSRAYKQKPHSMFCPRLSWPMKVWRCYSH